MQYPDIPQLPLYLQQTFHIWQGFERRGFLNVEMANIHLWLVSTQKKQTFKVEYPQQRQHSEGRFQIILPLFGAFFTWQYSRDAILS